MSITTFLYDLHIVLCIMCFGFLFRCGMRAFDALLSFLTVRFQKKKP